MTSKTFFTGLFMAIMGVIVSGFATPPIDWALMAATAIATVLGYLGGNLAGLFPSISNPFQLKLLDWGCALLTALGVGVFEYLAMIVVDHKIVWPVLVKVVLSVTATFLTATFFAPPKKEAKKLKLFSAFSKTAA